MGIDVNGPRHEETLSEPEPKLFAYKLFALVTDRARGNFSHRTRHLWANCFLSE